MAAPRWQEVVRWQSERLIARRTHRGLGPRMEEAPSRGHAMAEWTPSIVERSRALGEKAEAIVPPPGELQARDLSEALGRCQKPFQLWNVPRQVKDHPFELSHEPAVSERLREGWPGRPEWTANGMLAASAELADARAAARESVRPHMEEGESG